MATEQIAVELVLADINARLVAQFPSATPRDVHSAVGDAYARFAGARVRDFVPLLVERQARTYLSKR